jgi:putative glutamine amidotransferase
MSPAWQHEPPHPKLGTVDAVRDDFEITLVQEAFRRQIPVLGICRGAHIINVAAGGTIYQDVGSQRAGTFLDHLGDWAAYIRQERGPNMHAVNILPQTIIEKLMPAGKCVVNSYHHQAIKGVATGFRIAAVAEDGVVEAIESTTHPFMVGLQWHADLLWELAGHRNLFELFVAYAAHKNKRK